MWGAWRTARMVGVLSLGVFICAIIYFREVTVKALHQKVIGSEKPVDECPDYNLWSQSAHEPLSNGVLKLPYQRPPENCRTFHSETIESTIKQVWKHIVDDDLKRLFENTFPNTLDTTVKYHQTSPPLTFVVTGDIDAEWLRDSHRQLSPYIKFSKSDESLRALVSGAIELQARYVQGYPYCNAFHPPPEAKHHVTWNSVNDKVRPKVDLDVVFECKQELDSLASFLGLSNEYYEATGDTSFMTSQWKKSVRVLLQTIEELSKGSSADPEDEAYAFQRPTDSGTETLGNKGTGNPVREIGLIRSHFRPSDDAAIYQFFIPANAQMSVELEKLSSYVEDKELKEKAQTWASKIKTAIYEHAVFEHPKFKKVFAYEVDGYGSRSFMDDANIPSLLSLPDLGFLDINDEIYQNTRAMLLSHDNPYYASGSVFDGISSPHIGVLNAWPMSKLVAIRTTNDIDAIVKDLRAILRTTNGLGLIHESVHVNDGTYTRPWMAWANSEFAKTILNLYDRGLLLEVSSRIRHD